MAISAGVESTVTATTATQKERNKKQTTHQAQKQLSKRACCLCAWQIEKARKAGQLEYLPLFVPIGTLSRRTKSLRSSGVLKAV
jgi:hypothetical protein